MKLPEYLSRTCQSQRAFSRRAGVAQMSMYRIEAGRDVLGETWARIEAATNGCVARGDYFDPPSPAPWRCLCESCVLTTVIDTQQ